jgi:hypothetical protein
VQKKHPNSQPTGLVRRFLLFSQQPTEDPKLMIFSNDGHCRPGKVTADIGGPDTTRRRLSDQVERWFAHHAGESLDGARDQAIRWRRETVALECSESLGTGPQGVNLDIHDFFRRQRRGGQLEIGKDSRLPDWIDRCGLLINPTNDDHSDANENGEQRRPPKLVGAIHDFSVSRDDPTVGGKVTLFFDSKSQILKAIFRKRFGKFVAPLSSGTPLFFRLKPVLRTPISKSAPGLVPESFFGS